MYVITKRVSFQNSYKCYLLLFLYLVCFYEATEPGRWLSILNTLPVCPIEGAIFPVSGVTVVWQHSFTHITIVIFRCSPRSSMSEEHLMGPSMSVCLSCFSKK